MSENIGQAKNDSESDVEVIVAEKLSLKSGKNLSCRYWHPSTSPKALVILVHGFAEHLSTEGYEELAKRLAAQGLLAFGHDHVGHGKSDGIRAYVEDVDEYVNDVLIHCDLMSQRYPELGVYAVGHSMGGMITLASALKKPEAFKGVVLMGPLIFIDPQIATPWKMRCAKIMSRIAPHMPVGWLEIKHVSRDLNILEALRKDPLRWNGAVKCKWAIAAHACLLKINEKLDTMKVPFLILHGEKDYLCNPQGSRDLHTKAVTTDKDLKIFPEAYHNLYIELNEVRQEALKDTVDWICERI